MFRDSVNFCLGRNHDVKVIKVRDREAAALMTRETIAGANKSLKISGHFANFLSCKLITATATARKKRVTQSQLYELSSAYGFHEGVKKSSLELSENISYTVFFSPFFLLLIFATLSTLISIHNIIVIFVEVRQSV